MDQAAGAGHHAVTHMAVQELFSAKADHHELVHGYTQQGFFGQLDQAQEHQDRWYGPTTHAAWADPHAQMQHAMGSPYMSGAANLNTDRDYIVKELDNAHAAHAAHDTEGEMAHLGAAAHALEDSYSDAHVFRDLSVYSGNEKAHIEAFNVFDPLGLSTHGPVTAPVSHVGEGTHDARFDVVPVDKSGNPILLDHQAAAKAVADMLGTYFDHVDGDAKTARDANLHTVDQFFQPSIHGVEVNAHVTDAWKHERDDRLTIREDQLDTPQHQQQGPPHLPDPQPPAAPSAPVPSSTPVTPNTPSSQPPNDGGLPVGGTTQALSANQQPVIPYASNAAANGLSPSSTPGDGTNHNSPNSHATEAANGTSGAAQPAATSASTPGHSDWQFIPYASHAHQGDPGAVAGDGHADTSTPPDANHTHQQDSSLQTPDPHSSSTNGQPNQPYVAYASNDHSSQPSTSDQQHDQTSSSQQQDHSATTTNSANTNHAAASAHDSANMADV